MNTTHRIIFGASQQMSSIPSQSVQLVVTSPPYPMIAMWDEQFSTQDPAIAEALRKKPYVAYEQMHQLLDIVWQNCYRVLSPGGILCINIGDATRSTNGQFAIYTNHSRITSACERIGFSSLPGIIWRKVNNQPNKFMGSGMLPCGAYVSLEHEHILIFREGEKRAYSDPDTQATRNASAYFWEERNRWFSDVWEIPGVEQRLTTEDARSRSAAYPLEIPYRLIQMYSIQGDTVLDPFLGTGTTQLAAMVSFRNSIGFELDTNLRTTVQQQFSHLRVDDANAYIKKRFDQHMRFVKERESAGKPLKYFHNRWKMKVMTGQETAITWKWLKAIEFKPMQSLYNVHYTPMNNPRELPFFMR